ncbi:hypothetical protein [Ancylobacter terrae]|uniref:hypothetical protein n=1 Tax=Ancylobacter sp. sgz301288 TaxID=3342077 RepID=UPI00385ABBF6
MSRTKGRVLFFHELNGSERQLFFVLERSDHSLVIVVKGEDNLGTPRGVLDNFKELSKLRPLTTSRISIHNSDLSHGILIKYTNEVPPLPNETHACFIMNGKEFLLWPAFYKLYPDLSNSKYDVIKSPDRKIKIGHSWTFDSAILCISVIVCGLDVQLPEFSWNRLSVTEFNKYRIAVYHCFLNVVPNRDGVVLFGMTEKGGIGDGGVKSLEIDELSSQLLTSFEMMAAIRVEQHALRSDHEVAADLRSHRLYFHPTVEDLMLGRLQRQDKII